MRSGKGSFDKRQPLHAVAHDAHNLAAFLGGKGLLLAALTRRFKDGLHTLIVEHSIFHDVARYFEYVFLCHVQVLSNRAIPTNHLLSLLQ